MNQKKAKQLRKQIYLANKASYTKKNMGKEGKETHYKVGYKVDEQGKTVAYPYEVTNPIILEPGCGRYEYQQAKKLRS